MFVYSIGLQTKKVHVDLLGDQGIARVYFQRLASAARLGQDRVNGVRVALPFVGSNNLMSV